MAQFGEKRNNMNKEELTTLISCIEQGRIPPETKIRTVGDIMRDMLVIIEAYGEDEGYWPSRLKDKCRILRLWDEKNT